MTNGTKNFEKTLKINAKIKARKKDAKRNQNELKGNKNGAPNPSKMAKRDERGATRPPKWPKK